ncbi:ATP-binding cassette domain-containing protein [Mycoplasma sp. NEAQ87857]|uniref:ABC transporter ATP-binding protein n=1 Tax=Mycoplasma sp. NEAQ87857 TaxID=2683967 RepID=UPI001319B4E8|nr:ABC transporter ATP-binding protein [Mycoplasma sp. NEAQ87857]QGZ97765.1 ATP-binding cassette domain-containing protein [Mycoplasma sp. NEAQ87857]
MKNTLNNELAVEIKDLSKSFKDNQALNNLSFKVYKGQLFGFLGLNGAGKSTTLNIVLGLLSKDSGTIWINGENAENNTKLIRSQIGIVFQESLLDHSLTVKENLMIRASMYQENFKGQKIKDIVEAIIKEFQLEEIANRAYGKLSGGQRRRVDIARALVHKPSILFLDEPTTGLDPGSRKLVWDILYKIQKERKLTIILTTHYMEEANNCEYAIIIQKGVKLQEGTPSELKRKFATTTVKIYAPKDEFIEQKTLEFNGEFQYTEGFYLIEFIGYQQALDFFREINHKYDDFEFIKGTMDQVFLNVTKGARK